MKFNKKIDTPTVLAFVTVLLMVIIIFSVILLVPYLGFQGLLIFLQKLNFQDLISMSFYDSFFKNFFYVIGFLFFVYMGVLLLELIFVFIKFRKIINMSSFLERVIAYIILVCCNVFMVKFITDNIFMKIEISILFSFFIFIFIYLYLFITGDVYKKQDALF